MKYADIEWRDGQPWSTAYDDIYFSSDGGREESAYVFLEQNGLPGNWQARQHFVIAETGFGTGLNFVLTMKAWLETANDTARLHYVAIEKHPVAPDDIRRLSHIWPDLTECFEALLSIYPLPVEGSHSRSLFNGRISLHFLFMDVQQALTDRRLAVDAWYLDGFGPSRNPDIWSNEVFLQIAHNSHQATTLATFSCAGDVRRGLGAAGFEVSKVPGFGRKRQMITARLQQQPDYISQAPWYKLPAFCFKPETAIIIGAGIAGLCAAWSLVQRGWKVTVIDKHQSVAQQASGNPAGLVLPRISGSDEIDAGFYSSAFLYAVDRLDTLQKDALQQDALQRSDKDLFWFKQGVISMYAKKRASRAISQYDYPEHYMALLESGELPAYLDTADAEAACLPMAGWVIPARLCKALVRACGASLQLESHTITVLEKAECGWNVIDANAQTVASASVVVIANGVGVKDFEQTSYLPVSSVRGQVTTIPVSEQSAGLERAISFDAYVTPPHAGMHCAGATFSRTDQSDELQQQDQNENLDRLERILPGMFDHPDTLQGRVGFRAVSKDRVPLVGALPDIDVFECQYKTLHHGRTNTEYEDAKYHEGLFMSAAHGSRGLCSSFLCAEIIAAMVENTPLPVGKKIIDHLAPARFIVRRLRRNPKKYLLEEDRVSKSISSSGIGWDTAKPCA